MEASEGSYADSFHSLPSSPLDGGPRAKTIEFTNAARQKISVVLDSIEAKACTAKRHLCHGASTVDKLIGLCFQGALTALQELKCKASAGLSSARAALQAAWGGLKKEGLRAWLVGDRAPVANGIKEPAVIPVGLLKKQAMGVWLAGKQAPSSPAVDGAQEPADSPMNMLRKEGVRAWLAAGDEGLRAKLAAAIRSAAADKQIQVSAASAVGGAVALGAGGGATGLAAGGTLGAAVGLVPAVFTFGLSVPIFAAIGGGAGLVAGTAVGGAIGAVGGGAVGYGVYSQKEESSDAAPERAREVAAGATRGDRVERTSMARWIVPGGRGRPGTAN